MRHSWSIEKKPFITNFHMCPIPRLHWLWINVLFIVYVLFCAYSLCRVWLFVTPWTVAHQSPLSMGILQARILDCHALLQGIFPTQGSNPGLPHCRQILYHLSHQGSPRILEWVAYLFSRGSSWPRDQTGVFCIADGFFNRANREALYCIYFISKNLFIKWKHSLKYIEMCNFIFLT